MDALRRDHPYALVGLHPKPSHKSAQARQVCVCRRHIETQKRLPRLIEHTIGNARFGFLRGQILPHAPLDYLKPEPEPLPAQERVHLTLLRRRWIKKIRTTTNMTPATILIRVALSIVFLFSFLFQSFEKLIERLRHDNYGGSG